MRPKEVTKGGSVYTFCFCFCFCFCLATPGSMWDLSSPTRDGTRAPCSGSAAGLPGKSQRLYLWHKEKTNLWRIDKTKKFELGWPVSEEVGRSAHTAVSALNAPSLVMTMSPDLLVQWGDLSCERFVSCFQGHRGGQNALLWLFLK